MQIGREVNRLYLCSMISLGDKADDVKPLNYFIYVHQFWHRRLRHVSESVFFNIYLLNKSCNDSLLKQSVLFVLMPN